MTKLVILITGQEKRLELLSKIKYIINPLKVKYNVIVVLSLSKTENFTNKQKYKKIISTPCNIKKELENINYYINNIEYPEFKINKELVAMYDKQNMGEEYIKNRALNHVKQYYTLANSWPIIKKIKPIILIRIRDDAILSKPLELSKSIEVISNLKKFIITPDKNKFKGINDKFAIVSNKAIAIYLKKPFKIYNCYENNFKNIIKNPEQFYKYVYMIYNLSIYTSNIKVKIVGQ